MASLTKTIVVFSDGSLKKSGERLPIVPYKLGIIKQDLRPGEIGADTGTSITVQARKMNDSPKIGAKGDVMVVSDAWYLYMKKLMTQKAWEWWGVIPYFLMINRESKWSDESNTEMPRFECIALPNNFIASDLFINGFARVVARNSRNFNTNTLIPERDNWYYFPWQFWKATAHDDFGNIWLVGSSFHVYTPVIKEAPDLYIEQSFVEWFPELPMDVTYNGKKYTILEYATLGASVYGHALEMDVPLRIAKKQGECFHPCPEWKLQEKPVPPEIRTEWQ